MIARWRDDAAFVGAFVVLDPAGRFALTPAVSAYERDEHAGVGRLAAVGARPVAPLQVTGGVKASL